MTEQIPEEQPLGAAIQKQILNATAVALGVAVVVYALYNLEVHPMIVIAGAVTAVGAGMTFLVQRFGVRSVAVSTLLLWGGFAVGAVMHFGGGNG